MVQGRKKTGAARSGAAPENQQILKT